MQGIQTPHGADRLVQIKSHWARLISVLALHRGWDQVLDGL